MQLVAISDELLFSSKGKQWLAQQPSFSVKKKWNEKNQRNYYICPGTWQMGKQSVGFYGSVNKEMKCGTPGLKKISDIRPQSSPVYDSECILVRTRKDRHKNHPARWVLWIKKDSMAGTRKVRIVLHLQWKVEQTALHSKAGVLNIHFIFQLQFFMWCCVRTPSIVSRKIFFKSRMTDCCALTVHHNPVVSSRD